MFRKPFVYLSEAIVTPTKSTSIIASKAAEYGGSPVMSVQDLWTKAALSVSRQATLFRHPGFKGEMWHRWLTDAVEMVANGVLFEDEAMRRTFKADLMGSLGKPSSYYVPEDTRQFLDRLSEHGIAWGIIANENHLYQAVLKYLRLTSPGPVLCAAGPALFKPLPRMWSRAVAKAPAQSKNDLWFVGSVSNPCDNMALNSAIRCALVAPHLLQPDPVSQHFRISQLSDLEEPLLGSRASLELPDFNNLESPEPSVNENADVVLRSSSVPLLSREGQEPNLANLKKKNVP